MKVGHGKKVRVKMKKRMKKKQSGKLQLDSLSLCFSLCFCTQGGNRTHTPEDTRPDSYRD
jgi:hypothetical protein